VDSDYLFGNFLQLPAFRSTDNKAKPKPAGRTHSREAVFASRSGDTLPQWALAYTTITRSEDTSKNSIRTGRGDRCWIILFCGNRV
jgi:hypothetical protein